MDLTRFNEFIKRKEIVDYIEESGESLDFEDINDPMYFLPFSFRRFLLEQHPEWLAELYEIGGSRPLFDEEDLYEFVEAYQEINNIGELFKYTTVPKIPAFKLLDWVKDMEMEVDEENAAERLRPLFDAGVVEFKEGDRLSINDLWSEKESLIKYYIARPILLDGIYFDFNSQYRPSVNNNQYKIRGQNTSGYTILHFLMADLDFHNDLTGTDANHLIGTIMNLNTDVDPNIRGDDGKTPLMFPTYMLKENGINSPIEYLIDMGADPNIRGSDGTPVILMNHEIEDIDTLLYHGADPDVTSPNGVKLIHLLVLKYSFYENEVDGIIEGYNIDCDVKITKGLDPDFRKEYDLIVGTDLVLYSPTLGLTQVMIKNGANLRAYHPDLGNVIFVDAEMGYPSYSEVSTFIPYFMSKGIDIYLPEKPDPRRVNSVNPYPEFLTRTYPLKYSALRAINNEEGDFSLLPKPFQKISEDVFRL